MSDNPAFYAEETSANNPHKLMWDPLYASGAVRSKNSALVGLAELYGRSMSENDCHVDLAVRLDADSDGDIDPATSAVTVAELPTTTGEADTELFSSAAHGLAVGDEVVFTALTGGTGLVTDTVYFVVSDGFAAGAFKVSETAGGTVKTFSTDVSGCTAWKCSAGFTAGSARPFNLEALTGLTASPLTAWTPGTYVLLGDGSYAHWSGTAWAAGKATA
jgi:hypothetical protein